MSRILHPDWGMETAYFWFQVACLAGFREGDTIDIFTSNLILTSLQHSPEIGEWSALRRVISHRSSTWFLNILK